MVLLFKDIAYVDRESETQHAIQPTRGLSRVGFHYLGDFSIRIKLRNPNVMRGMFHWLRSTQPTR